MRIYDPHRSARRRRTLLPRTSIQHSLFHAYMREVYREFFDHALKLTLLRPVSGDESRLALTGYPQGLPCREVVGGADALTDSRFRDEYDAILQGFLDFYRSFFSQVSMRNADPLSHRTTNRLNVAVSPDAFC